MPALAKIFHPEGGHTSLSVGGKSYTPGPDGAFEVPAELVGELLHHGFKRGQPPAPPPPPEPEPAVRKPEPELLGTQRAILGTLAEAEQADLLQKVVDGDVEAAQPAQRSAVEAALAELPPDASAAEKHEAVERALAPPAEAVQDAAGSAPAPTPRRRTRTPR